MNQNRTRRTTLAALTLAAIGLGLAAPAGAATGTMTAGGATEDAVTVVKDTTWDLYSVGDPNQEYISTLYSDITRVRYSHLTPAENPQAGDPIVEPTFRVAIKVSGLGLVARDATKIRQRAVVTVVPADGAETHLAFGFRRGAVPQVTVAGSPTVNCGQVTFNAQTKVATLLVPDSCLGLGGATELTNLTTSTFDYTQNPHATDDTDTVESFPDFLTFSGIGHHQRLTPPEQHMAVGEQYRNITFAEDGTVLGELSHGAGRPFVSFRAALDLLWIEWACAVSDQADEEIWDLQDGYDDPDLGWDWSGIRDSSPAARRAMLEVARRHLAVGRVAARLGADAAVVDAIVADVYRVT